MIIAVTGSIAAGETTVCGIFETLGFNKISLSDMLRREAKKRNLSAERDNLRSIGDELRKNQGKDVLAKLAYELMDDKNWVVDSVLSYEEGQFLKSKGALIIGVMAPVNARYERSRDKLEENLNMEAFLKKDEHDRGIGVDALVDEADFVINNDGTLKELEDMISLIIETISSSHAQK